jgi:glycosyltransferase involved in cell wall biosynthesis
MAANLSDYRLVFVGPATGKTAVGDYGDGFVDAVRPYFGEIVEVRTGAPNDDGVADIRRYRKEVRALVAAGRPGRVLVHAEIAAGGVGPFWATQGLKGIPVTSTIHDPPHGVWMPARTRWIASSKWRTHAIHYPLRPVSQMVEGAVYGDRTLFALTKTGQRAIERTYPKVDSFAVPYRIFDRPDVVPAEERPKAIGFFGLVYRGKGFEQISAIRAQLPDDILIRVAGRGTEALPKADGIEIVGAVEGPDEDAFFQSVRAIVVPYGKRHFYAETYPASAVVAHATAYQTPVICTAYGSLAELTEADGVLVVPAEPTDVGPLPAKFGSSVAAVVNDHERLTALGKASNDTRHRHGAAGTAAAFATVWSNLLTARERAE